jgi:hypothetical protein
LFLISRIGWSFAWVWGFSWERLRWKVLRDKTNNSRNGLHAVNWILKWILEVFSATVACLNRGNTNARYLLWF